MSREASNTPSVPQRHGGTVQVQPEALLASDPALHLVWADMDAWSEAHPCNCHAECKCGAPDFWRPDGRCPEC